MELASVVAAGFEKIPNIELAWDAHRPKDAGRYVVPSNVMIVSRSKATIAKALAWSDAKTPSANGVKAWTDDYFDIFSSIVRKYSMAK